MKRVVACILAGLVSVAPAGPGTLYVGHGIDGRDLSLPQALSVDVCLVSGPLDVGYPVALFTDVEFGQFARVDLDLPAGIYGVEVQLASGGSCEGTVAIASSFPVNFGETATAFAHLTEYGKPALTKYVNDARPAPAGKALVSVRHAAAFGDVNVLLRRGHSRLYISGLENPDQEAASVAAGR